MEVVAYLLQHRYRSSKHGKASAPEVADGHSCSSAPAVDRAPRSAVDAARRLIDRGVLSMPVSDSKSQKMLKLKLDLAKILG